MADLEADLTDVTHLLPTKLGHARDIPGRRVEVESQESFNILDFCRGPFCFCLGPVFGWLGFRFLDAWWPERRLSPAEWELYWTQQKHKKDVDCIRQAMKASPSFRATDDLRSLRSAILGFAGSAESVDLSYAELKAMFLLAYVLDIFFF